MAISFFNRINQDGQDRLVEISNSAIRREFSFIDNQNSNQDDGIILDGTVKPYDGPRKKSFFKFDFQENILNRYDSYSYRFRFFMISESLFSKPELTKEEIISSIYGEANIGGIILCETGSTSYNITRFEMNHLISPSYYYNSMVTSIEMEVTEPLGISFIDSIIEAKQILGISNPLQCPYFILLDFIGSTNGSGEITEFGFGDVFGSNVSKGSTNSWLWRVMIQDIKTEFTSSGTKYKITMIPYDDIGRKNTFQLLRTSMNLDPVVTVGDFLIQLEKKLNEDFKPDGHRIEIKLLDLKNLSTIISRLNAFPQDENQQPTTERQTIANKIASFSPNPADWKLYIDPSKQEPHASSIKSLEATSIRAAAHDDITHIIRHQILITEEGRTLLNLKETAKDVGVYIDWDIRFEIRVREYNKEKNSYSYDITLIIFPVEKYEKFQMVRTNERVTIEKISREKSLEQLRDLNIKGYFVKRYDYFFTGLNTEVIDLNLDLDALWTVAIANNPTKKILGNFFSMGAITSDIAPIVKEVTGDSPIIPTPSSDQGEQNVAPSLSMTENLSTNINFFESSVQRRQNEIYQNFFNTRNLRAGVSLSNAISTDQAGGIPGLLSISQEITKPISRLLSGIRLQQVNQLQRLRQDRGLPPANYIELAKPTEASQEDRYPIPVTSSFFDFTGFQRNTERGVGQEAIDRLLVAEFLNNTQIANTNLITIEMKIKGDPYWLGLDSFDIRKIRQFSNNSSSSSRDDSVNFFSSLVHFLLVIGFPESFDSIYGNGGFINQNKNYFSGIYMAFNVKSYFESGKFTQVITASRNLQYDVESSNF